MSGNSQARIIEVEFDDYIEIQGIFMFSHRYRVKLTHDEKEEFDKINAEIERTNIAKVNSQKALDDFEKELEDKNIKIFDIPQLKEKWHQLIEMNIRKYSENISANAKLNGFKCRYRSVHLSD